MSKRNFENWLKTFRTSINGYDYYTDFAKVYENAGKLKDELNILNLLIGAEDIKAEFTRIITKYPDCIKAIPLLLAVREHDIYCQDKNGACSYNFAQIVQTPEQYSYFMKATGLFDLLQKHIISNLYDYVMGVEVGLDSNGRKNRGGHQMENLIESYLKKSGITYSKEVPMTEIRRHITLPEGLAPNKRWDFAVKTDHNIYVIETNFYASGGLKLNETARSYRMLAEEIRNINGFIFVWITDGKGWFSAKHNLEETFNVLEDLYNIADVEAGIFTNIFH